MRDIVAVALLMLFGVVGYLFGNFLWIYGGGAIFLLWIVIEEIRKGSKKSEPTPKRKEIKKPAQPQGWTTGLFGNYRA